MATAIAPCAATGTRRLSPQAKALLWKAFIRRTGALERRWAAGMRELFEGQRREVVEKLRRWAPAKAAVVTEAEIDSLLLNHAEWNVVLGEFGRALGEFVSDDGGNGLLKDLAVVGVSFDVQIPAVQEALDERYGNPAYEHVGTWPQWINNTTNDRLRAKLAQELRDQIGESLTAAESIDRMEERVAHVFGQAKSYRTQNIARTEVMGCHSLGADAAMVGIGAPGKQWFTTLDGNERPDHAAVHLVIVPFDKPFIVGGVPMMHPHAFGAPAKQVCNCRCNHQPVMDPAEVAEALRAAA